MPTLDPDLPSPNPHFQSNHVVHFEVTGTDLDGVSVSLSGTVQTSGVTVDWPADEIYVENGSTERRLKIKAKSVKHRRKGGDKVIESDSGDVQVTVSDGGTPVSQGHPCSYDD